MNPSTQNFLMLLGRIAMSVIFIVAGIRKAMAVAGTVAYMQKNGVPFAEFLAYCTIVLEIGGGLALLLGWKLRSVAAALAIFVLVITPIFHAFWTFEPAQYANQLNHFMKNLALAGGLIYMLVGGAGAYSIDGKNTRL